MSTWLWIAVGLSAAVQMLAALLALRINWKYGRQHAWTLIAVALVLTAVQRCVTTYPLIVRELPIGIEVDYEVPRVLEEGQTLLISLLMLAGVAFIEPLFRSARRIEELLRAEKGSLQTALAATEREMAIARAIQQRLFPARMPVLPGFEIAGRSYPARATGGDYFDYLPLDAGRLGIVIGDVSGHGLGPALLMAQTHAYLAALAPRCAGVELVQAANAFLCGQVSASQFVALGLALLDARERSLLYIGAGHRGYILRATGDLERLEASGPPLGIDPQIAYAAVGPLPLAAGDLVLLLTDGLEETRDACGVELGIDRLMAVAREHAQKPAEEILERLYDAGRQYAGQSGQEDDITLIVVRVL